MKGQLNPAHFVRIHRSLVVNVAYIQELRPWAHDEYLVTLHSGAHLISSRSYSSGVQLAQLLPAPAPLLVFTTAFDQYAVQSYTLQAADYLLKPIAFNRFLQAALTVWQLAGPAARRDGPAPGRCRGHVREACPAAPACGLCRLALY